MEDVDNGGRLAVRCGVNGGAKAAATVSVSELALATPSGAAQLPQKRLVPEFSVAQLGQRTIAGSVATAVNTHYYPRSVEIRRC